MEETIYWCPNCDVPLLSKKCFKCGTKDVFYCSSDLKPVFKQEKSLFEEVTKTDLPSNLFRCKNRIISSGKTLFRYGISNGHLITLESKEKIKKRLDEIDNFDEEYDFNKIKAANYPVIQGLVGEATRFIKKVTKENQDKIKFVSFSGGKDSTVTAMLVKNADVGDVPLFFSDTTLEFEETYAYIEDFKEKHGFKIVSEKSEQDFFELCKELGPPSQTYRWCCTVFKTYPVNKFYKTLDENQEILTFDGIRASESPRRKKYSQITRIKKIPRQVAAYPILHWREADVWFYLLLNKIDYNPLYGYGHTRVGCWACPAASPFNCIVRRKTHPDVWKKYEKILYNYADKVGRDHKWVDDDYWRLRRPKKDLNSAVNIVTSHKLCGNKPSFTYNFKEQIDEKFLEFLKPFGTIRYLNSPPTIFQGGCNNPLNFTGIINSDKINAHFTGENFLRSKKRFEKQITKALNCVSCGGCLAACPYGAISIINNKFTIDENKCTHCQECINSTFISNGCIALNFILKKKILTND